MSYVEDSRSQILKDVSRVLNCLECDIVCVTSYRGCNNEAIGFTFMVDGIGFKYCYLDGCISKI